MPSEERAIEQPVAPPSWRELGVFVLDGSNSMNDKIEAGGFSGTKAEAVNAAMQGLLTRFKVGGAVANFTFAVVKFHEHVKKDQEMTPTPAALMDDYGDYDPTTGGTGGTFLGAGLERAQEICEEFFGAHQDDLPTTAVVLLLTDGQCLQPERTKIVAEQIKTNSRIKLATAFFATKGNPDEGYELLQTICSDATKYCRRVYDPETLRKFFHQTLVME